MRTHLRAAEIVDPLAAKLDRPGGRLRRVSRSSCGGRLAAAGLADETQGLAFRDAEADAIDGINLADGAREQALVHGKVLLESLDLEERHGA